MKLNNQNRNSKINFYNPVNHKNKSITLIEYLRPVPSKHSPRTNTRIRRWTFFHHHQLLPPKGKPQNNKKEPHVDRASARLHRSSFSALLSIHIHRKRKYEARSGADVSIRRAAAHARKEKPRAPFSRNKRLFESSCARYTSINLARIFAPFAAP